MCAVMTHDTDVFVMKRNFAVVLISWTKGADISLRWPESARAQKSEGAEAETERPAEGQRASERS